MTEIAVAIPARRHLDGFVVLEEGRAQLSGWIFREDVQIKCLDIYLDGKPWVSSIRLRERPDVRAAYPAVARDSSVDPGWSGFDVTAPLPETRRANSSPIICLTPLLADGTRLASVHTYFHDREQDLRSLPQPPERLQNRIGGSDNFLLIAGQLTSLILSFIGQHRPFWQSGAILDWGCGCGRVMAQMMKLVAPERLHGCDIDAEAIAWDKEHLMGPSFSRIEPYPPTSYADDSFDIIYGISVMTHLDEEAQFAWLRELQRIARPGAIVALTVIGEDLRRARMPAELSAIYDEKGFAAYVPDYSNLLAEFSHPDYYQESYHSLTYIAATWSEFFEIVEYVETKHQDFVILRAR